MIANGKIVALNANAGHSFSKTPQPGLRLIAGEGVANDAHRGVTVKHRSRVIVDPTQPNLRQVHLIHSELFSELAAKGFAIGPGEIGENITTQGIDLLSLPRHTRLYLGAEAVIQITGLRNPCIQLDHYRLGLMKAVLDRGPNGELIRKAGTMSIVITGGSIKTGDMIHVELPEGPHLPLERV
jgi:hypothetical protein